MALRGTTVMVGMTPICTAAGRRGRGGGGGGGGDGGGGGRGGGPLHGRSCRAAHAVAQLDPGCPDLLKWLHQHGGFVHPSLRIQPSAGAASGLGLVPALPIPSGSLLISLPHRLMLSLPPPDSATALESSLLSLTQRIPEEFWALRLGLRLLMERAKKDSFWWPYISNLPQRFNLPVFFSGQEIGDLQYAPIVHQVKRRCKALLDLATVVASETKKLSVETHPFGGQMVDAGALGWAMAAASSRAFNIHNTSQVSGDRKLLPLVDMCNHSFQPNAHIVQQTKENVFVTVVAEENLQAGMPILLNYGALNNDMLLLDYGFVVSQNPHDVVELRYDVDFFDGARSAAGLKCSSFHSPAPWQHSLLEKLALYGGNVSPKVNIGGPDLVDGRLLAALRVLFAEDSEIVLNIDLSLLQTWCLQPPLGHVNESSVLRTLIMACALVLGHFPTTIKEDEKLLTKQHLLETSRLAVQYRLAKKQTLVDAMRGFTQKLHQLHNGSHLDKMETTVNGLR